MYTLVVVVAVVPSIQMVLVVVVVDTQVSTEPAPHWLLLLAAQVVVVVAQHRLDLPGAQVVAPLGSLEVVVLKAVVEVLKVLAVQPVLLVITLVPLGHLLPVDSARTDEIAMVLTVVLPTVVLPQVVRAGALLQLHVVQVEAVGLATLVVVVGLAQQQPQVVAVVAVGLATLVASLGRLTRQVLAQRQPTLVIRTEVEPAMVELVEQRQALAMVEQPGSLLLPMVLAALHQHKLSTGHNLTPLPAQ